MCVCNVGDVNLELGTQRQYSLDDFELIKVIGRGSYAKVLMVELKKNKRIYAMKVIKKALVTDDEVSIIIVLLLFISLKIYVSYIYFLASRSL